MKKNVFAFSLLAMSALLAGCNGEVKEHNPEGNATVMVNLASDLSYSRSFNESEYQNTKNYTVLFAKTSDLNNLVYSGKYSDMALDYKVESGESYTITASYGEDVSAGYDKLYVKGTQTFAVAEGDKKTIEVKCVPANARLKLAYSDDFSTYYSDCKISVKTEYMEKEWTMGIADKDKELFMKTGDQGTKATLTFQLLDLDGQPVTVQGMTGTKEISLSPRDSYTLTVKPNVTEIQGGKLGVSVTIDNGVTEEDINVVVPGDWQ